LIVWGLGTHDGDVDALANVRLLSNLFPACSPVLCLLLSSDNAELDDDGVLVVDSNRVVVECNDLALELDADDNNLDDEVLDNLLRGIIFGEGGPGQVRTIGGMKLPEMLNKRNINLWSSKIVPGGVV